MQRTLRAILREMEEEHGGEHAGWIEHVLERQPQRAQSRPPNGSGTTIDAAVVADLEAQVDAQFKG